MSDDAATEHAHREGAPPMSAPEPAAARPRDAERSRQALLDAGAAVFAEKGYSRARLRDIAERAGLDAALVIRYFGSKDGLYRATLEQGIADGMPDPAALAGATLPEMVDELVDRALTRWEENGVSTIVLSLSRPDAGEVIRAEVRRRLDVLITPMADAAAAAGLSDPRVRAEAAIAALVGIGTTRSLASLPTLAAADRRAVEPMVRAAIQGIFTP